MSGDRCADCGRPVEPGIFRSVLADNLRRAKSWRYWLCPFISAVVFTAMGGELASRWYAFSVLAFLLGRIDKEIDP